MGLVPDNIVVAGDYKNKPILQSIKGDFYIQVGIREKIFLTKENIEKYEVQNQSERSNTAGKVGRGLVGGALFGRVGAIIGATTSKKKSLTKIAIDFKDGKRSLVQMNGQFYSKFLDRVF